MTLPDEKLFAEEIAQTREPVPVIIFHITRLPTRTLVVRTDPMQGKIDAYSPTHL